MKTILNLIFILVATIVLISCSNDNNSLENSDNLTENSEIEVFLNAYYGNNQYTINESEEAAFEFNNNLIQEVNLKSNPKRVGYIFTDNVDSHLTFFVDLNKNKKEIYAEDLENNKSNLVLSDKIDSKFFEEGFSFFEFLDNYSKTSRFWGWECTKIPFPNGDCQAECRYHAMFIPGEYQTFPCDDMPGRYGK